VTPVKSAYSRVHGVFAARRDAAHATAESGQALVFALIVVLIMSLLPAIVLMSLNQEMPLASEAVTSESALAAAEAGIQEYSNLMDQYPGYYTYAAHAGGATPANDPGPPALPGGNNLALGAWQSITPSNPPESFTYYPDYSELSQAQSTANPFGGNVLLVITGKAGIGKTTQYRRIEAAFSLSGVITDVYFSNFEQPGVQDLDQWQNTYQGGGCQPNGSGCSLITSSTSNSSHEYDEATVTTPCAGAVCYAPSEPMATALCQYDAVQVNTFIDWYSTNVSPITPQPGYPGFDTSTPYSAANPYYGPWYGSFPDPSNPSSYQFGVAPTSGSTNNGDSSACLTNYWITGDTFNGPVYSNDMLTTCGSPAFTANPGLQTSVPKTFFFPAEKTAGGKLIGWPGAQAPILNTTGSGPAYISYPRGYIQDPWSDGSCGSPDAPSFSDPQSPRLGISQPLPPANQALIGEVENGSVAGCVYTGPTMIRFTYTAGKETMVVWSPLTKDTYGTAAACGAVAGSGPKDLCGGTACTGTPGTVGSNTQVISSTIQSATTDFAQVAVTTPEVIVVQNAPSAAVDPNNYWNLGCALPTTAATCLPNAEASATVAGCIDPWVNPDSGASITDTGTCLAGDAIISGAVGAQITLSASNDVVLARSVVYGCAVNANGTYQSTLTNCAASSNVLGIIALNDIWMSRPWNPATNNMAPPCADDTDLAAASVAWTNMVPNCTVVNPTVDAATAALTGFFEVEYWREGDASGKTLTFNGSDAVNDSGQFGVFGGGGLSKGYLLTLNYDPRLIADPPPQYLPATDGVWNEVGWVTCADTTPNPDTAGYPSGNPDCIPLAGSYPP